MVIGKIKPTATIVAQFAAGVEVEAIQHDGKMFLPIVGMGEFATKDDDPKPSTKKTEPTPEVAETKTEAKSAKDDADKKYTEDELMEMSTKDLLKMCKSMGIDPDATDGKNTNKKLRTLILNAQDTTADADADDEDEDEDDDNGGDNELTAQVSEILEDFDGGKKNKKKTISAICALVDDADKDAVAELVEKFEDDADADIDKIAEEIANVLAGSADEDADDDEDEDDEEETPKSKGKSKKSKKDEDLVDVKDLKVGDRVSVWWDDDNQEWYDGEVKSISKKGKVVIAYDDDTEDVIDPEVHTKIKRLDD